MSHIKMGLAPRQSVEGDLAQLTKMLEDAIALLAVNNVDQWQNGTISSKMLLDAIIQGQGFVWEQRDTTGIAGFCVLDTYDELYEVPLAEGKWTVEGPYLAIHRVMVSQHLRGRKVSTQMFLDIKKMGVVNNIASLRIDTHPDNIIMQKTLKRNGFARTGLLYMPSGSPRYTYEFDLSQF
ncbi:MULTISPECIES: GNAT family N-acetyltransferase [unclassified Aerococcus]|uniref:GNAT family N-acetyltransferase n=1 Tax=unclassified Aerococcus TaxID=2618060 RepID=UPI0025BA8AB6|nr:MULTISPECIES: GNAT family N-acetyltransferase [unclassified Aerococcus]